MAWREDPLSELLPKPNKLPKPLPLVLPESGISGQRAKDDTARICAEAATTGKVMTSCQAYLSTVLADSCRQETTCMKGLRISRAGCSA